MTSDYEKVLMEYFDINDDYTRKTLLTINEADKSKVMESLTSKLYQSIMNKVDDIDFGSVPDSKGDITKIENYDQLVECIGVIKSLLVQYGQSTKPVDTIQTAIENIQDRKDAFEKAFNLGIDLPITLYNTIVLSIVSSTSLLIAASIEYIKDSSSQSYDIKLDKVAYVRTSQNLLFQNLEKFNRACDKGEVDRSIEHITKTTAKNLLGVDDTMGIVAVMAVIGILVTIIPVMRELIFFFFNTKQQMSDYFTIQADLLEVNAEYVKNNTLSGKTDKERKEIAKKQSKIAERFRKIGNALMVKNKQAEAKTKSDIKKDDRKHKVQDVINTSDLEINKQSEPEEDSSSSIF